MNELPTFTVLENDAGYDLVRHHGPICPMTSDEIARAVRNIRLLRGMDERSLAKRAKISTDAVQQVEAGRPSDAKTRRAIGRALQMLDPDVFTNPVPVVSYEQINMAGAAIQHALATVANGPALISPLLDNPGSASFGYERTELPEEVEARYRRVCQFLDSCHIAATQGTAAAEIRGWADTLDEMLAELREVGFCVCMGTISLMVQNQSQPHLPPVPCKLHLIAATPTDNPRRTVSFRTNGIWTGQDTSGQTH